MVDRGMFDKQGFFLLDPRLDLRLRSQIPVGAAHAKLLPPNYHPGNWDVICHSGKDIHDHSKAYSVQHIVIYYESSLLSRSPLLSR
jgi:hypothetical protein